MEIEEQRHAADALALEAQALDALNQGQEAIAVLDELFDFCGTSRDLLLRRAAAFSRRGKVGALLNAGRPDEAFCAADELLDLFREAQRQSTDVEIARHLADVGYMLSGTGDAQLALDILGATTVLLNVRPDDESASVAAAVRGSSIVAATRARDAKRITLETDAMGQLGPYACYELNRLIERLRPVASRRPELAQLMLAKIGCLEASSDEDAMKEAVRDFIDRFEHDRDVVLRTAAVSLRDRL